MIWQRYKIKLDLYTLLEFLHLEHTKFKEYSTSEGAS